MDNGRDREPRRPRRRYYDPEYDSYSARRPYPPRPRPRNRRRRRRVLPTLLGGCLLGILVTVLGAAVVVFLAFRASQGQGIGIGPVGGTQTFTHEDTTQVALSTLSQIQICDKIGNISIQVDPNATTAIIKSKKIVHKNTQKDADQAFGRIAVEVQPPGTITNPLTCTKPGGTPTASSSTPTTNTGGTTGTNAGSTAQGTAQGTENSLTVNVTIPDSEGLLRTTSDAVDLALTLPGPAVQLGNGTPLLLDIEAPVGNITVDGVSGSLQITGGTGNVKVSHVLLTPGSHIGTAQGNVTFTGALLSSPNTPDNNARYVFQSEKGNIDVTLPSTTNVTLDANTNVGAIHSEFPIKVNNNGGPVNYHGPLNSEAPSQGAATLTLNISTGNINIHKSQT